LLGGSFNPVHGGHVALSLLALKRLNLDAIWWLVSPQNPLKNAPFPLSQRIETCERFIQHPKIKITALELTLKTRYTYATLAKLQAKRKQVKFIWLMGADNLTQFHRWKNWKTIASKVDMAVIDRPTASLKALSGRAAHTLKKNRINEEKATRLGQTKKSKWLFLHGLKNPQSSTALRG
jgi:nicotinate-nucleotide adenylyltransferase